MKLVSIIIPCYNCAWCIKRLFESILDQKYSRIQIVFVNDGSADNLDDVLTVWRRKFEKAGVVFDFISQENQGLGGAINTGLKHIKGDYLVWPDSDDFLEPGSILKRVAVLDKNPHISVVTSDAYVRDSNSLDSYIRLAGSSQTKRFEANQFEELLHGRSMFIPGTHMVRVSSLKEVNPTLSIYPARRGQNWQLLLPLYYSKKRYYLDEPLYSYIKYQDSMSVDSTLEEKLYRIDEHERIIQETLIRILSMPNEQLKLYSNKVIAVYLRKRAVSYFKYKRTTNFINAYQQLAALGERDYKISIMYFVVKSKLIYVLTKKFLLKK